MPIIHELQKRKLEGCGKGCLESIEFLVGLIFILCGIVNLSAAFKNDYIMYTSTRGRILHHKIGRYQDPTGFWMCIVAFTIALSFGIGLIISKINKLILYRKNKSKFV